MYTHLSWKVIDLLLEWKQLFKPSHFTHGIEEDESRQFVLFSRRHCFCATLQVYENIQQYFLSYFKHCSTVESPASFQPYDIHCLHLLRSTKTNARTHKHTHTHTHKHTHTHTHTHERTHAHTHKIRILNRMHPDKHQKWGSVLHMYNSLSLVFFCVNSHCPPQWLNCIRLQPCR